MSKINKEEIKSAFYIVIGSLLIALSVVLFFVPHNFTTGGTPGMAILLYHMTNLSIGSLIVLINIPLLIFGIKYLGKIFAIKTVITIILISSFTDFFTKFLDIDLLISNILVAAVFGGLVIGFGVGFIIKGNSSAGGSSVIAKIVCANSHLKASQIIFAIDALIVISSIYIFKDFEKAVLSVISIYVTAKAMDVVLTGALSTKVIHITTNEPELLSQKITENFGIYGTILNGSGIFKHENKTLIFLVLDVKKLRFLKQIIHECDKDAFMIVMEASEMLGRGH
ncbi:YitT family protein [Campylobacterota bacterium DY0563]